jgi:hypothetical protein
MKTNIYNRVKPWLKQGLLSLGLVSAGYGISNAQIGQNYVFSQSAGTFTPITGGTVIINGALNSSLDSWVSSAITIPPVSIDGVTYTTAYVTSNGLLKLGGSAPTSTLYTAISTNPSGGGVHIAPFNADLNKVAATAASEIRWEQVGNEIIFQWSGWCRYGQTENFDFQARLNTVNSNIVFVYNLNSGPGTGTSYFPQVGIASANTTNNYLNRLVGTIAGQDWNTSVPGTSNTSTLRFTGSATNPRSFTSGQTYTFTYDPPSCLPPTNATANNITENAAQIQWSASLSTPTIGYEYYYSTSSSVPSATTNASGSTAASVTTANINGLAPNTTYYLWVRAICSSSDTSIWNGGVSFKTLCTPITSYFENFDSYSTGNILPDCWNYLNPASGSMTISSTTPASGTRNIYQYVGSAANAVYAVLPPFSNVNAGTHQLRFKARISSTNANAALNVGYLTDPTNASTWVNIQTVPVTNTTYTAPDAEKSIVIPNTVPAGARLAIANLGVTSNSYYFDDVYWEPAPSCFAPITPNATSITNAGATLNWTAPSTAPANGYEYYYNTTGVVPDAATIPTGTVAPTVTTQSLTGLTAGTLYNAWVRSVCSSNDKSTWAGPVAFSTPPTCGSNFIDPGGPNGNYADNVNATTVISPTSGNIVTVTFSSFATESGWDYLKVYDGPDATAPALHTGSGFSGTLTGASLPGPFTSTHPSGALTFVFTSDGSNNYAGWEASVTCTPAPTCIVPTNLTTSAISTNGATIGWTAPTPAPANGYEYYYSTSSTAPTATTTPSGTTAAGVTSANLTSLTANTTYYYWVRSICAPSDKSDWTATSSFYTGHCIPQALTTSTSYYVSSVVTSGAAVDLNYSANTAVPYVNATTTILQTYPSNSFTFTIAPSSGTNYYYLWVDWNNDLDFNDAGETIFATTSYTASHTGTITIPASQATGSYRMRVSNSFIGANTPCGPATYGNYVDFTLVITPPPTCIAPTNLSVNAITSTGATINWTPSTTTVNVGYDYYISTTNVTPAATATPTGSVAATATSATDNSLSPATTYHYWVRSNCAATDQSAWAYGGTFTTLCATFSAPFVENFNNGVLPNCWINENNTNSTSTYLKWWFTSAMGYGTTGNGGKTSGTFAWVDASSPYNLGDSVILSTPAINLATLVAPQVGFDWFKRHATSSTGTASTYDNNRLSLDIKNINSNTWTTLFSDTSNANFWRSEDINIPANFLGQTVQFRLVVNKNTNGNGYFYDDLAIDSFRVVEGPCTPPVVALGNDTSFCEGATLTLDAGAGTDYTYAWSTGDTTQTIDVTLTGTYSVIVDNGTCSATDTIVVSIIDNPVVDLGNDTTDCVNGGPITLTAGTSTSDTYAWSTGDNTPSITATTSGTYSVVVTNAAGCQGTDTINVIMGQEPTVGGITSTGTSPEFTFNANNPSNVNNYSWDFGDGNTSDVENPTHTYATTGNDETYTVTLIVSNDCGADTVTTTVTVNKNSINDLKLNNTALKLYPNPAQEIVTVQNASQYKMKQVAVFNMLGQEVLTLKVNNTNQTNIDISKLNAGMYQVRIDFEEGSVSRKLEILK